MGSNQSSLTNMNNFNINEWNQLSRQGEVRVLCNRNNNSQQIEEHPFTINSRRDIDFEQKIINLRRGDPYIIGAYHYIFFNEAIMPYQNYLSGLIYTQRICTRLPQAGLIGFPGFLHVFAQAIFGFQKLAKQFNYFRVNPNCIGINPNQVVKVWHNPNFAQLYPFQPVFFEQQMILSLLDSIQQYVDFSTAPRQQPSFKQFLLKNRVHLKFENIKNKLLQYANYFNQGFISASLPVFPLAVRPNFQNSLNRSPSILGHRHNMQTNFLMNPIIRNPIPFQNNYLRESIQHNVIQPSPNHIPIPNITQRPHSNYQRIGKTPFINQHHLQNPSVHQNVPIGRYIQPQFQNRYQPVYIGQNRNNLHFNSSTNQLITNPSLVFPANNQRFVTQSVPIAGIRTSHMLDNSSVRSHSVQSERNISNYKPLSVQYSRQNQMFRSDSQNSFEQRVFENPNRQRSHSQLHPIKPYSIPVGKSHYQMDFSNYQIDRQPPNINSNNAQVHRSLKPVAIRHAIQGAQFRQSRNQNFGSNIRPQYLITQRSYNVDSAQISTLRNLVNSNHLGVNVKSQQSQRPSPQFGEQSLSSPVRQIDFVSKRLSDEYDWQRNNQRASQPQTVYDSYKQFTHSKKQNTQTEVSQNDSKHKIKNEVSSVNQQQKLARDFSKKQFQDVKRQKINLQDVRQSQSVNNSLKNFYSHNFKPEDLQAFEVSSPVQYKLSSHRNLKIEGDQGLIINKINLFQKREQFTPLDFMQKLKITETIKKDEDEAEKLQVPSDEKNQKAIKSRSRSRQFCKDVAKLGFLLNSQDSNNDTPTSKDEKPTISKQLVNEWTPTYKEEPETQAYTTVGKNESYKYQYNKNDVDKMNGQNQWSASQAIYKKAQQKTIDHKYPTYEKPVDNYEFEWDPQILADIQSKVHDRQIFD